MRDFHLPVLGVVARWTFCLTRRTGLYSALLMEYKKDFSFRKYRANLHSKFDLDFFAPVSFLHQALAPHTHTLYTHVSTFYR